MQVSTCVLRCVKTFISQFEIIVMWKVAELGCGTYGTYGFELSRVLAHSIGLNRAPPLLHVKAIMLVLHEASHSKKIRQQANHLVPITYRLID